MAGSKPGERRGGRQKGTPNKANTARIAAAAQTGDLPHEFLLKVMRGERIDGRQPTFEERIDAAGRAAPYYAPKLASVAHSGKDGSSIVVEIKNF